VDSICSSDHKPVFASFDIGVVTQFTSSHGASVLTADMKIALQEISVEVVNRCRDLMCSVIGQIEFLMYTRDTFHMPPLLCCSIIFMLCPHLNVILKCIFFQIAFTLSPIESPKCALIRFLLRCYCVLT